MHPILKARATAIRRTGSHAVLRRQTAVSPSVAYTSVGVVAAIHDFAPGAIRDGYRQGDRQAEIGADEISQAGWPAPPRPADTLDTSSGVLAIISVSPVEIAGELGGWRLWVRGP